MGNAGWFDFHSKILTSEAGGHAAFGAPVRNQSGQIVIEYMLLMVVVIALSSLLLTTLRQSGALKALVFDPFAKFDGMIQCGVWEPCGVSRKVPNKHSNTSPRVLSLDPKLGPR